MACRCQMPISDCRRRRRDRSSASSCSCSARSPSSPFPCRDRVASPTGGATTIVPFFGAGRFILPFALLVAGWYVEWGPGKEAKAPWRRILIGMAVAFVGFLGVIQLLGFSGADRDTGGRIGRALESVLVPLVTNPGAFVIVLGMFVVGLLVMFDTTLRTVLAPVARAVTAFMRVTRLNGRRQGHAGASRDRAWHRRAAQVERQGRRGCPIARPDRSVGRRRRHDPGRRSEQGPDLEHIRARSGGRRCSRVGDPGRPGAARS